MKKILINFAHPAKSKSIINSALRASVEQLENVTINDLYANYPDFLIDTKREQKLCEESDVIVFQYPLYWYSTPSIMKEWQDLVLEHGWAYGKEGNALKGRIFLQVLSAGGSENVYRRDGLSRFTIKEFSCPLQAMADQCKMIWLPPFTVLGVHRGLPENEIKSHAENYRRAIIALRDDTIDVEKVKSFPYLNHDLNSVIRSSK